ncbi:MAG: hypothetical protein KDA66_11540 [Planctomycetaceae bacterium]|nr:hypothetical protein [Planctomycetaceae bacterium]
MNRRDSRGNHFSSFFRALALIGGTMQELKHKMNRIRMIPEQLDKWGI